MAVSKARAVSEKLPLYRSLARQFGAAEPFLLPVPLMNVMNGGKHADSGLSLQECMIVPCGFTRFSDAIRAGVEVFMMLKKLLHEAGHITAVGDEGGFAPRVKDSADAFSFLARSIEEAGYGAQVKLAIDCAASEFYDKGVYTVDGKKLTSPELTTFYAGLVDRYPIVSIEDSHSEDDWDGFKEMQKTMGKGIQLVGDDLLVTNVTRLKKAIEEKAANAILIKLNQIGTVTETVDAIQMAQKNGWRAIVSHRSGETEDTFIADLAVALGTGQIKTGSASRTDRVCKYNQLLRIEEELGAKARYESPFKN
jgi:enolase